MHRFTPLEAISDRQNYQATTLVAVLVMMLVNYGCSSSQPVTAGTFSPPQSLSGAATPAAARSLSSMEAISRGVASVTPPGAPLKDVYYQFDSVELEGEAIEVLKKNAEWLKANPKARVEVEGHCDDVGSRNTISPSAPTSPNGKRLPRQPRHRRRAPGDHQLRQRSTRLLRSHRRMPRAQPPCPLRHFHRAADLIKKEPVPSFQPFKPFKTLPEYD